MSADSSEEAEMEMEKEGPVSHHPDLVMSHRRWPPLPHKLCQVPSVPWPREQCDTTVSCVYLEESSR